jgi:hypothetical protein
MAYLIVASAVLMVLGRLTTPTRALQGWPLTYEALAHIWIGMMLAWASSALAPIRKMTTRDRWLCLAAVGAVTVFEVVAFLMKWGS